MLLRRRTRPGYMNTVELLFYLPIVILAFLAVVQFSQLLAAEARFSGASREGARVAASGGNGRQIEKAVLVGLLPGEKKLVTIETNALDSQGQPVSMVAGNEIVVRVTAPTGEIVPTALWLILAKNRVLVGQTVMRKE